MKVIENLNKSELLELKSEIDKKLKNIEEDKNNTIKINDIFKNKTKLCQLTTNDIMFGIGLHSEKLDVFFCWLL